MKASRIFAIGDIHGCAAELRELLKKLPLDKNSKVIFLGDYIDRGPDSKGVIDEILKLQKTCEVITLMGNHEEMLLEFLADPSSSMAGYFILNGGSTTLASYSNADNHYVIPDSHMKFFKSLQLTHETENHFFVHAGVPNVKLSKLEKEKHFKDLLWIRRPFLESPFRWEKTIVHGHSPVPEADVRENRINLDTGCVYRGSLTAMDVTSGEIYSVQSTSQSLDGMKRESPPGQRAAQRFNGVIPVYVEAGDGYQLYETLNYNEFGLLIIMGTSKEQKHFEVGDVISGMIGRLDQVQLSFSGEVVRHSVRGREIAYGIKMVRPVQPIKDSKESIE